MKWFFIINAVSANGKTANKIDNIINYLNKLNFDYEIKITKIQGHATQLTQKAIENGFRYIVAVGGDGTINEVMNGIMKTGKQDRIYLGILPCGSGNDFAKALKLPNSLKKNIKNLQNMKVKKVDLGKIENYFFINTLGIGFNAKIAKIAKNLKFLNGFSKYFVSLLLSLISLRFYKMKVKINSKTYNDKFLLASIGNGKFSGKRFNVNPKADLTNGKLNLVLVKPISRLQIIKFLKLAMNGKLLNIPQAINMDFEKEITISLDKTLPLFVDGELIKLNNYNNMKVEVLPKAISVICS